MATWAELGMDCRSAAKDLIVAGHFRSSISRAYYAAYSAVSSRLQGVVDFAHDGNNPAHDTLPNLILNNLYDVPEDTRREIRKSVARLWKARVEADYVPTAFISREIAVNALRDASRVLLLLRFDADGA